jgi:hypothetical protein
MHKNEKTLNKFAYKRKNKREEGKKQDRDSQPFTFFPFPHAEAQKRRLRRCLRHDSLAVFHAEAQRRKGAEEERRREEEFNTEYTGVLQSFT